MLSNCAVGEDSWESLGLQGDPTSPSLRKSVLNIHWEDWCWSYTWRSNTLATWCKELTHWKRPWCWERLKAGREGEDRGWDGWLASTDWLHWAELMELGSVLIFFTCSCPVFWGLFIEEAVFSPLYILASFVKSNVLIGALVYFWGSILFHSSIFLFLW